MPGQNDRSVSLNQPLGNRVSKWLGSRFGSFKKSDLFLLGLVFALLLVFSIHNFDSIGQDIGRHLKIGGIIWQTKEIPKTNLFSFTEPDFPFSNHHWLSEVIFYKLFVWFGFTGLILLKSFLILVAFGLLFLTFLQRFDLKNPQGRTLMISFWPVLISLLFSLFIFISRTEVRPEIFSFAILAFFLFALFKVKYSSRFDLKNHQGRTFKYLWFLPLAQLLWVNLHIYFFIGPFLVLAFLIDCLVNKSVIRPFENSRAASRWLRVGGMADLLKVFLIFLLTSAATLVNPAWLRGALLPFHILKEYGYSIVENQTLSFLAPFFGFNLSIFAFKLSVAMLAVSFLLTIKKARQKIFEILISVFFIYAGFKMLRNLPLYALASFPILAILLTDIFKFKKNHPEAEGNTQLFQESDQHNQVLKTSERAGCVHRSLSGLVNAGFRTLTAAFLIFFIFFVANNSFYNRANLSRAFGLAVPNGLERATNFVKENKIKGPMFNNFDIGGYLIWKLYPEEKVFVDNRPEAYSVKFFSEIYKPMQEDKKKWAEFSEKYGINFIFFGHTDATPWGQAFLKNIIKNLDWAIVYINENAIILIKNNQANAEIISRWAISEANANKKVTENLRDSNANKTDLNLVMSRVFYNINWRKTSLYFAEEAIKADQTNQQAYLNKGLVHAFYTDAENQKLAGESIKKAIDLGLKDGRYYTILGIVYMNLGRLTEAETWFAKALELDEKNEQAREFLNKYFKP